MNFKKDLNSLANDIFSKDYVLPVKKVDQKIKSSNLQESKKIENDFDLNLDLNEDFDLDIEEIETDEESSKEVEQLFDGYLGEKNFAPNPLEYGPNAMYRQNGTVYRKSVDNLWEAYLKDGSPGPRGAAGGSGTGVQEVQRIVNSNLSNGIRSYNSKANNTPPKGNVSWNAYNLFYKDTTTSINWDNMINEYTTSAIKYIKDCGGKVFRCVYPAYRGAQVSNSVFNGNIPDREFNDNDFNQSFIRASDSWFDYLDSQDVTCHLTLFWELTENVYAVGLTSADLDTEFRSTNTRTVRYMKNFAKWVSARYKNRKSISMYSIGNEYSWEEITSETTYFNMEQMTNIFNEINSTIKSVDEFAKVTADLPGPASNISYVRKLPQWYIDTYSYIFKNLDAWCVHIYYNNAYIGKHEDYDPSFEATSANSFGYESLGSIVSILSNAARSEGKYFILGETGIGRSHETDSGIIKKNRLMTAIKRYCDYGMIWNIQRNDPPVQDTQLNWWTFPSISGVDTRAETYKNIMKYTNANNQDTLQLLEASYSDSLNFKYHPSYELASDRITNARISFSATPQMATSGDMCMMLWFKINSNLNAFERIVDLQGETSGGCTLVAASSGNTSWYIASKDSSGNSVGSMVNAMPVLDLNEWVHVAYVFKNLSTSSFYEVYLNGTFWNVKIGNAMGTLSAGYTYYLAGVYANANGVPVSIQDFTLTKSVTVDDILKHMKGEVLPQSLIHIRAMPDGKVLDLSRYNNPSLNARAGTTVRQVK